MTAPTRRTLLSVAALSPLAAGGGGGGSDALLIATCDSIAAGEAAIEALHTDEEIDAAVIHVGKLVRDVLDMPALTAQGRAARARAAFAVYPPVRSAYDALFRTVIMEAAGIASLS